jgi:hypothetical protein
MPIRIGLFGTISNYKLITKNLGKNAYSKTSIWRTKRKSIWRCKSDWAGRTGPYCTVTDCIGAGRTWACRAGQIALGWIGQGMPEWAMSFGGHPNVKWSWFQYHLEVISMSIGGHPNVISRSFQCQLKVIPMLFELISLEIIERSFRGHLEIISMSFLGQPNVMEWSKLRCSDFLHSIVTTVIILSTVKNF